MKDIKGLLATQLKQLGLDQMQNQTQRIEKLLCADKSSLKGVFEVTCVKEGVCSIRILQSGFAQEVRYWCYEVLASGQLKGVTQFRFIA